MGRWFTYIPQARPSENIDLESKAEVGQETLLSDPQIWSGTRPTALWGNPVLTD